MWPTRKGSTCGDGEGYGADGSHGGYGIDGDGCHGGVLKCEKAESREIIKVHYNMVVCGAMVVSYDNHRISRRAL
jgi:hypothetical protein